jgi:hypothetical protein
MNLGARLNTGAFEAFPTPSADGMTLYFNRSTSFDSEDSDIWMTTRSGPTGQWTEPERLPNGINSTRKEPSSRRRSLRMETRCTLRPAARAPSTCGFRCAEIGVKHGGRREGSEQK